MTTGRCLAHKGHTEGRTEVLPGGLWLGALHRWGGGKSGRPGWACGHSPGRHAVRGSPQGPTAQHTQAETQRDQRRVPILVHGLWHKEPHPEPSSDLGQGIWGWGQKAEGKGLSQGGEKAAQGSGGQTWLRREAQYWIHSRCTAQKEGSERPERRRS